MRVLLVDDHPLFLEGLRNLLRIEGIDVVGSAADGLEALAEARRLRPDVILMDVQMPRCDGVSATRLIKAELPATKIVMLTLSEDDQDLFEAVKSGASGYLLKKLKAREFFTYLTELEAGHPPFSPGLAEKVLQALTGNAAPPEAPAAADAVPGDTLTPRQLQILTLVAQGQTYREVAETIGLAERTVKYHMGEMLERLHLKNRAQVIAYATRAGLLRPEGGDAFGEE